MKIALFQGEPAHADPEKGLAQIDKAARDAAAKGADLLVTPEMSVTGYAIGVAATRDLAQQVRGPYFDAVSALCKTLGIAIAYGYPERGDDDAIYNTAQLVDAQGEIVLSYRKTHLFGDVDRAQFTRGDVVSDVVSFGGMNIALALCYDVEFPELVRLYTMAGVDLLIVPTANMVPFDSVCDRALPVHAEVNGIGIAFANYVGKEGLYTYCGRSAICGVEGDDLARADKTGTALIMAEFTGRRLPKEAYLKDRRPDLYGPILDST